MDEHAHLSLTARSRQEDRYGDNDDMENGSWYSKAPGLGFKKIY
jgi:hypothetical protein